MMLEGGQLYTKYNFAELHIAMTSTNWRPLLLPEAEKKNSEKSHTTIMCLAGGGARESVLLYSTKVHFGDLSGDVLTGTNGGSFKIITPILLN